MTQQDIDTGAAALKAYVQSIDGLEAAFVPWNDYEQGAEIILKTWDIGNPQNAPGNPDSDATAYAECGLALYKVISDAGFGDRVTPDQCAAGAAAVITATRQSGGSS